MQRSLFVLAVGLVLGRGVFAGESHPGSVAPKPAALSGRKKVEAILQSPARLDFGERKRVAATEILGRLRSEHQLSIRFDLPTFAWLFGADAVAVSRRADSKVAHRASQHPLDIIRQIRNLRVTQPVSANSYRLQDDVQYFPVSNPPSGRDVPQYQPLPFGAGAPVTLVRDEDLTGKPDSAPSTPVKQVPIQPAAAKPVPLPNSFPPPPIPAPAPATPQPTQPVPQAKVPAATSKPESKPVPATESEDGADASTDLFGLLLSPEIDTETVDLKNVSVATALQLVLDAAPMTAMLDDLSGVPIPLTNALMLDYLIEEDGLLITTRLKALTHKETRVYSVRQLKDCPAEQLAKIIRQSVRPWSWRSQINDLGEQLKSTPLPTDLLGSMVKTGVQLIGAEVGASVAAPGAGDSKSSAKNEEGRELAMLGNVVVNGLVTFAHAALSAVEMVHYAEPPTATIQTIAGKLIVTQSQAAHREIAELIRQLEDE